MRRTVAIDPFAFRITSFSNLSESDSVSAVSVFGLLLQLFLRNLLIPDPPYFDWELLRHKNVPCLGSVTLSDEKLAVSTCYYSADVAKCSNVQASVDYQTIRAYSPVCTCGRQISRCGGQLVSLNGASKLPSRTGGLASTRLLIAADHFLRILTETFDAFFKKHAPNDSKLHFMFSTETTNDFDGFLRYYTARRHIHNSDRGLVLDVGGEGRHFNELFANGPLAAVSVNINPNALSRYSQSWKRKGEASRVLADGRRLPFRDRVFCLAISLSVLNQVPPSRRRDFVSEMVRVADRIFLQVAASPDPVPGSAYRRWAYWRNVMYRDVAFLAKTSHCAEHNEMNLSFLRENIPGGLIRGHRNQNVWLWTTWLLGRTPALRRVLPPIYWLLLNRLDWKPPYYDLTLST